jgi:hypothetical protein
MKNIFLSCVTYKAWTPVVSRLIKTGHYQMTGCICWRDELELFEKEFKSSFYTVESMWAPVDCYVESKFIEFYSKEEEGIAIQMMNRQDPMRKFSTVHRKRLFSQHINKAETLLKNIDVVVSPSIPHRVFDYALYLVAKKNNIMFITFQATGFGSSVIPISDINSIESLFSIPKQKDFLVIDRVIKNRCKNVKLDYSRAEPMYMKKHRLNRKFWAEPRRLLQKITRNISTGKLYKFYRPNTYWMSKKNFNQLKNMSWLEYFFTNLYKVFYLTRLRKEFNCNTTEVRFHDTKFVYLALHYQPEETTCPSAGRYVDQIKLVRDALLLLPKNILIYIKEHPCQFDLSQEGNCGRELGYYDEISALDIDRVKIIDSSYNSFECIDQSIGVITCTGTVGWEARMRSKPVLTAGRAWYAGMPNVYSIFSDNQVQEFVASLKSGSLNGDLNLWHKELSKKILLVKHYKGWENNTDIDDNSSEENLFNFISSNI